MKEFTLMINAVGSWTIYKEDVNGNNFNCDALATVYKKEFGSKICKLLNEEDSILEEIEMYRREILRLGGSLSKDKFGKENTCQTDT